MTATPPAHALKPEVLDSSFIVGTDMKATIFVAPLAEAATLPHGAAQIIGDFYFECQLCNEGEK